MCKSNQQTDIAKDCPSIKLSDWLLETVENYLYLKNNYHGDAAEATGCVCVGGAEGGLGFGGGVQLRVL